MSLLHNKNGMFNSSTKWALNYYLNIINSLDSNMATISLYYRSNARERKNTPDAADGKDSVNELISW